MSEDYDDDDDSNENGKENKEEEIEEIEFSMTDEEIDEWIAELKRLKAEKDVSILPIDESMQLKIDYKEILDL
jgi:hypothetical protein